MSGAERRIDTCADAPAPDLQGLNIRRRLGRTVLAGLAAGFGAPVVGLGLPSELMGSASGHQEWRSAPAETLIVDGETLRLGERMLRLDGLDAPERGHRPSLSPLEAALRQAQRGLWSGGFEPPAYWRWGN